MDTHAMIWWNKLTMLSLNTVTKNSSCMHNGKTDVKEKFLKTQWETITNVTHQSWGSYSATVNARLIVAWHFRQWEMWPNVAKTAYKSSVKQLIIRSRQQKALNSQRAPIKKKLQGNNNCLLLHHHRKFKLLQIAKCCRLKWNCSLQ